MKISNYFLIQELVPKEIYQRWGNKSLWFVDKRQLLLMDFIRERFGKPMIINNWHEGGSFNFRGYRPPDCKVGGFLSQHKFCKADDFNIEGVTPQEVYSDIVNNFDVYSKTGLTTVEDVAFTKTWTHVDSRWTGLSTLLIVKP